MAAGLGFKTFNTGDVLSAADVNGYLMQGVLVFADATARDAAITSPQEGQFAYTKDNNSLWYYSGSAWVSSGATGDIEGVTAGVGISGGGTSGTVTVTNSMATAIDAKGDLVVGTGADTFSKLTVGANGTTLVADSAEATGLKWATPASGSTFVGAQGIRTGSGAQSIANNTQTAILFDAEQYDTDAIHDTSTNTSRFTVPAGKGGYWQVSFFFTWDGNATGTRNIYLYKNGSFNAYLSANPAATNQGTNNATMIYNYAAADYIEFYAFQSSGVSLNVSAPGQYGAAQFTYMGA